MYAQVAVKSNILSRNGAYGIVMRGVQKCTCAGASLRGKNSAPLCCIIYMTATDAYMGTGAICTITAANTPGTIVNEIAKESLGTDRIEHLRIGHPWGIMDAYADLKVHEDGSHEVLSGNLDRTARRIMEGFVYVRD